MVASAKPQPYRCPDCGEPFYREKDGLIYIEDKAHHQHVIPAVVVVETVCSHCHHTFQVDWAAKGS